MTSNSLKSLLPILSLDPNFHKDRHRWDKKLVAITSLRESDDSILKSRSIIPFIPLPVPILLGAGLLLFPTATKNLRRMWTFLSIFLLSIVMIDPFLHYVRYHGKYILATKDTPLLMNKWKYYFVNLWQCYFSVWFQSQKVNINQLSKDNLEFLGYLSSLRLNPLVVRSQMLENSFLIDNVRIKLDSNIPISSIIGSLAKDKFCNVLGHPISKATWTDSSDSDILNRFVRICRNISHYYSGSILDKQNSCYTSED